MTRKKHNHETVIHKSIDDLFFDMIPKDYERFIKEVKLATTPRQNELLAAQSCHGHAMNGDKEFAVLDTGGMIHHKYLNSTISDVYEAIIRAFPKYAPDLRSVKKERHLLIKELKQWIHESTDNLIKNKEYKKYSPRRLLDSHGEPLMGIELFRHTSIGDPRSVLTGIYLGSYMDSEYWREQTEDYFKNIHGIDLNMHRGLCTAGHLDHIVESGMTLSDLTHLAEDTRHPERNQKKYTLESLKEKYLIIDFEKVSSDEKKRGVENKKPYVQVYVELNKGYGSSDDAAFNFTSLMYGMEAGFGLILIDAVDTADKCSLFIREKGEDELLGDFIAKQLGGKGGVESHLGITDQDILNLIFAAAIDSEHPNVWPSCSQRRFLEYSPTGNYALLNHMDNIKHICENGPFPEDIRLSIKQIPSNKFYNAFGERITEMLEDELIDIEKAHYPENLKYFLRKK
ncbi:hypothetical protein GOV06_04665 [Candidatus Woesearchaeota archaeon]|nr:hypothetical protein [Candidatus Woesearchaeota archaeon]